MIFGTTVKTPPPPPTLFHLFVFLPKHLINAQTRTRASLEATHRLLGFPAMAVRVHADFDACRCFAACPPRPPHALSFPASPTDVCVSFPSPLSSPRLSTDGTAAAEQPGNPNGSSPPYQDAGNRKQFRGAADQVLISPPTPLVALYIACLAVPLTFFWFTWVFFGTYLFFFVMWRYCPVVRCFLFSCLLGISCRRRQL